MIAVRRALKVPFVAAALAILLAALALAGSAIARALVTEPLPAAEHEPPMHFAMMQGNMRTSLAYIDDAVAAAPFTPSREATQPAPEQPETNVQQAAPLQLLGTVVGGDGDSFVLLAVNGEPGKVARVGETVGGYRLKSIGQGSAVLTAVTDGKRIELRVPRSR